jgi:hypothetical protein
LDAGDNLSGGEPRNGTGKFHLLLAADVVGQPPKQFFAKLLAGFAANLLLVKDRLDFLNLLLALFGVAADHDKNEGGQNHHDDKCRTKNEQRSASII